MGAVTYEVEGGVAWLTIDHPEARNALSKAVREGLFAGIHRFNTDDAAKALVLTGAGEKAFCAGGDLKEMNDTALQVPPPDLLPQLGRNIDVPKPTSEVKIGRGAPWAAPLSWLVPPRIAMEILLTGDPISAAKAQAYGLVNDVVPLAELRERTQALAERIAANAPLSVLAAKRTAYLSASHPRAEADDRAEEIWEPVYLSKDAQEGPLSFREKRTPVWQGS